VSQQCHEQPLTILVRLERETEIKARATTLRNEGEDVPTHMELPDLQDIFKMRPSQMAGAQGEDNNSIENDTTAFTFIVKHLVPAVVGKKTWNRCKCKELVSEKFTPSDEAFLYVILSNSYDLWKSANGSKVGAGTLTKDGTNKKYCGWTKQGIKMYNISCAR